MKLSYKVFYLFIVCILCYLLGVWIPIKSLVPDIKTQPVTTAEYNQFAITCISAIATFLAVLIAMFKEDIRKYWEFSKLDVSIPNETFFETLNSSVTSSTEEVSQQLEAKSYYSKIEIFNSGSIPALGLEIILESLSFVGGEYTTPQNIETSGKIIYWNGLNEDKINLSPEGKKTIKILELNGPTQQSSPEGKNNNAPPLLNIAGIDISPDFKKGKWIGSFAIFSTNANKPVRFELEIDWNGGWQRRATEMKTILNIKLKK